jgi:hypothetical protein
MIELAWLAAAPAYFETGNSLSRKCQQDDLSSACFGYVSGVSDSAEALNLVCLPKEVERGQIRDIVVRDLLGRSETRQSPAAFLVLKSTSDAYPCRK